MNKFIVDNKVFDLFPTLKIGVVYCENINNHEKNNEIRKLLDKLSQDVKQSFEGIELCEYPVIRNWRDAYKKFGEKKNRSSIEALIRSIVNGREIPSINSLVDIYNIISIKYLLPCGGEDIDKLDDDMQLTTSDGTEIFLPLGSDISENPNEGEIIYKFGNNVICRNFNYRESNLTKLTNDTKNAILCIECIDEKDYNKLAQAIEDLSSMVKKYLGGTTNIYFIDKENNKINF
jgi:DNA/RNA-binding domain of Phe-tRNA-synthetase-like protein